MTLPEAGPAGRRCPSCRGAVREDAASCSACGQRLALREDAPTAEVDPSARVIPAHRTEAEGPLLTAGDLTKEILYVGLAAGVLVSLPGLSLLNCCFCFLPVGAIVGPGLAWVVRSRGRPISMRAFAMAALWAGLLAGAMAALGAYGTAMLTPAAELEQLRDAIRQLPLQEDLQRRVLAVDWDKFNLLSLLVNLPLYASTGAIVGVIAAYATARIMIADLVREDA